MVGNNRQGIVWKEMVYSTPAPRRIYSKTPLIRTLVIRMANYPFRFSPSRKFVEISAKLTCPEITGYRIKYSTVLWLLELLIRRRLKV